MFLSGLKSRQVDSVKLPPIRCDPLNMRHQDFNIIFQPSKDATSGFVIIKKCRFKSRSYGTHIVELSRESPRPHSGCVGLEHSIHCVHVFRGNPQPSAHAPRSAVGRGHIRISSCKRKKHMHWLINLKVPEV